MNRLVEFINDKWNLSPATQGKIFATLIIIAGLWLIRLIILKVVWSQTNDVKKRYAWKTSISYILPFIGVFFAVAVWFEVFREMGAFLGLLSAGIAIALKDPLTNIAGWLFIIIRKPFSAGDRIQIGSQAGDIIDIRLFQFTLLEIGNWVDADQSTGRIIHIPNGKVFIEPQANYSTGFRFIWHEIPVLITFESNWEKTKQILLEIVNNETILFSEEAEKEIKEASKKYLIFFNYLTPTVYTTVKDSGILLTLRFVCIPRERRGKEQAIWESILKEFAKHPDIGLAYPTQRFYTLGEEQMKDTKKG
ncbi:MscS Mechanosensitive ion channel [hydrothermal vent metagenome]|uniref:MscS Mechanosensitive ion channel n=1 Tax=hydrothermal vent metagenome TaxID=652676 RepID=A0A3B0TMU9_9ZZZZ